MCIEVAEVDDDEEDFNPNDDLYPAAADEAPAPGQGVAQAEPGQQLGGVGMCNSFC